MQVQGSDTLWATLTWPAEASLWSEMDPHRPEFTGGIPCLPGASGCAPASSFSQRKKAWYFNEVVDGPLQPANVKPNEIVLATKGEGIYGVGLTAGPSFQANQPNSQPASFQATVAAYVQRCSPGHVPVAVAPDARVPDTVRWHSHGKDWYSQCVLPPKLSLNQPTRVCFRCFAPLLCIKTALYGTRLCTGLRAGWHRSGVLFQF